MFYILLCFYLWIYGTLNKISNINTQPADLQIVFNTFSSNIGNKVQLTSVKCCVK